MTTVACHVTLQVLEGSGGLAVTQERLHLRRVPVPGECIELARPAELAGLHRVVGVVHQAEAPDHGNPRPVLIHTVRA